MKNTLSKAINNIKPRQDKPRLYVSASSIGHECLRKIWYDYKGEPKGLIPTKTQRTWDIGHQLEMLVVRWLEDAGFAVKDRGMEVKSNVIPDFSGHIDGIITNKQGKQFLLEIKTAKNASFGVFNRSGLKKWNEQYYSQVQAYLGMLELDSGYMLVLNKDNSELADELIAFDKAHYDKLNQVAIQIKNANIAPMRITANPMWHTCKMCSYYSKCHGKP